MTEVDLTPTGRSAVRLALVVARVRRLHERRTDAFGDLCDHCRTAWPCATVRAVEGE